MRHNRRGFLCFQLSVEIPEDMSCRNMARVEKCPKNEFEWRDRESVIKCPDTGKADVYHCALNPEGTGFVEVCAPAVHIQGK